MFDLVEIDHTFDNVGLVIYFTEFNDGLDSMGLVNHNLVTKPGMVFIHGFGTFLLVINC